MALEDFVNLYEKRINVMQNLATAREDASYLYSPQAQAQASAMESEIAGEQINVKRDPNEIMDIFTNYQATRGRSFNDLVNGNLEKVVAELGNESLDALLLVTAPYGKDDYKDIAQLHAKYSLGTQAVKALSDKNTDDKEKQQAFSLLYSLYSEEIIEKKLKGVNDGRAEAEKLNEKELKMWTGYFISKGFKPKGFEEECKKEVEKSHKELKSRISGRKLAEYLSASISNSEDKAKENIYQMIYSLGKKKKKKK